MRFCPPYHVRLLDAFWKIEEHRRSYLGRDCFEKQQEPFAKDNTNNLYVDYADMRYASTAIHVGMYRSDTLTKIVCK